MDLRLSVLQARRYLFGTVLHLTIDGLCIPSLKSTC